MAAGGIGVAGKANLIMTFQTTHPALARALEARGYTDPTAVQVAVLEADAADRDLLVSAQTGSGKTIAFGIAVAMTLLGDSDRFEAAAEPLALMIAPTRELAMQVQRELAWLYADTGARVVTCVGGMDARAEARQLGFGAHIVVGTPGRLRDHLERRRLDLTKLKCAVLDEADEMLDLGFREDLEFILDATPEGRRTLLFSATMPREIEALAKRYQRDAVRIQTTSSREQHADIEYQAIKISPNEVEHAVVNVLRYHDARATLVFCATREGVKRLHARLVERGFSAVALSGELTQNERTTALAALRDGRARVLVATDVAARGLDLPDLSLVVHAELPNDGETLLHRSGRTGRAGRKGLCILMVPYNRRRKAEVLLGQAKLRVTWAEAPSADDIRARDQERFLADAVFTDPASEEDVSLAKVLQGERSADEIALALTRLHRARLPAPEDLSPDRGPPKREFGRNPGRERDDRGGDKEGFRGRPDRGPRPHRQDDRDMVWFRLNIGREKNADPKWLLPLICKSGDVSKSEIGSIKIFDRDTRFQIAAEHADRFAAAVRVNKNKEGQISRVGSNDAGSEAEIGPASAAASSAKPVASMPRGESHRGYGARGSKPDSKKPYGKDRPAAGPGSKNAGERDNRNPTAPKAERAGAPELTGADGGPNRAARRAAQFAAKARADGDASAAPEAKQVALDAPAKKSKMPERDMSAVRDPNVRVRAKTRTSGDQSYQSASSGERSGDAPLRRKPRLKPIDGPGGKPHGKPHGKPSIGAGGNSKARQSNFKPAGGFGSGSAAVAPYAGKKKKHTTSA